MVPLINRFLGCRSPDCALCRHNPHKRCGSRDSFDECYADNQVGIPGTQLALHQVAAYSCQPGGYVSGDSLQEVVSVGCYQVLSSLSYRAESHRQGKHTHTRTHSSTRAVFCRLRTWIVTCAHTHSCGTYRTSDLSSSNTYQQGGGAPRVLVQVLRARCEADIHVELFSQETGGPADVSGIEVQVCTTQCGLHTVFRGQGLGGL